MLATYPQQRPRPDKRRDRLAWEASWEDDLRAFYNRPLHTLPRPALSPPSPRLLSVISGSQKHTRQQSQRAEDLRNLQLDLAQAVRPALADEAFEKDWRNLKLEDRRQVVLEGIYQASSIDRLEDKRGLCPDVTLNALGSGAGTSYLRLLKAAVSNANVGPHSGPIFFPHRIIDYIWALPEGEQASIPGLKAWVRDIHLDRAHFMTMAVWHIFQEFRKFQKQIGDGRVDGISRSSLVAKRKACQQCGKMEMDLRQGQHLRACGQCMANNRRIYYCSRQCQIDNWKQGRPTPHREICGKTSNTIPEVSTNSIVPHTLAPDSGKHLRIPEPEPTFKRPPQLEHQISFLRQPPYVDYTFIFPPPLPGTGVRVRPQDRQAFLAIRDKALRNGSIEAVQNIYMILLPLAEGAQYPRESLKHQLEREFNVILQDPSSSWVTDTDGEDDTDSNIPTTIYGDLVDPFAAEDGDTTFPGALPGFDGPRPATRGFVDKLLGALIFYVAFIAMTGWMMLTVFRFLLSHPFLLLALAPCLRTDSLKLGLAFWRLFSTGHEYVWRD